MAAPSRRDPRTTSPPRKGRHKAEPGRRQLALMCAGLALAMAFYVLMTRLQSGPFELAFPLAGNGVQLEDDSFIAQRTMIEELDTLEERRLREQRNVIDELARRHIGTPLTSGRSTDDLRVLQELIDKQLLDKEQTYELQALGICLGDVMAEQLGLIWVAATDDHGRVRALQYGEGDDLFFPSTMISKRIEANVLFTVQELYDEMRRTVEALDRRYGNSRLRS